MNLDPHKGQNVLHVGVLPSQARAGMILLHGRAGTAKGVLRLVPQLAVEGACFIAPQAEGNSWYPERFTSDLAKNEPWVSSSLMTIRRTLDQLCEAGLRMEQVVLLGFSQGACLALEYVARNPCRYGGVAAISGSLMGEEVRSFGHASALQGTPIMLGYGDQDKRVPSRRVIDTATVMRDLGAQADLRVFTGWGHSIHQDELILAREMLARISSRTWSNTTE